MSHKIDSKKCGRTVKKKLTSSSVHFFYRQTEKYKQSVSPFFGRVRPVRNYNLGVSLPCPWETPDNIQMERNRIVRMVHRQRAVPRRRYHPERSVPKGPRRDSPRFTGTKIDQLSSRIWPFRFEKNLWVEERTASDVITRSTWVIVFERRQVNRSFIRGRWRTDCRHHSSFLIINSTDGLFMLNWTKCTLRTFHGSWWCGSKSGNDESTTFVLVNFLNTQWIFIYLPNLTLYGIFTIVTTLMSSKLYRRLLHRIKYGDKINEIDLMKLNMRDVGSSCEKIRFGSQRSYISLSCYFYLIYLRE